MGCMKRSIKHIRWGWAGLATALVVVCACRAEDGDPWYRYSEDYYNNHNNYANLGNDSSVGNLAVATVRSREGVRFVRLDGISSSQVINPNEIADIPDGTRVFLQYRYVVVSSVAFFCSDAILVEWASPLDEGQHSFVSFEESYTADSFAATDPVDIIPDWITSLEDDFLTLHYTITSGDKKHAFLLYRSMMEPAGFYLVHHADGDTGKTPKEGMVCFRLSLENLFPDLQEGETPTLTLHYLNFDRIEKTLTFEYRSPK